MIRTTLRLAGCMLWCALASAAATADEPEPDPAALPPSIVPTDYLVLPPVGQYGRLPLHRDALEVQLLAGDWKVPAEGDAVETPDGKKEIWIAAKTGEDGRLDSQKIRGGYALATFESATERVMMIEAAGHAMVYVNGEPRAGDPYSHGWLRLPVLVRQGQNTLLFHLASDKLSARLTAPPADVYFAADDRTLPTLIEGEPFFAKWGAVPVVNATTDWLDGISLICLHGDEQPRPISIAPIPPLSVHKVAIPLPMVVAQPKGSERITIRLVHDDASESDESTQDVPPLSTSELTLKVVGKDDIRIATFRSEIDLSVQSYAVRPAASSALRENAGDTTAADDADAAKSDDADKSTDGRPRGLIVTLHGAGVSCEDHVAQCAPKPWAYVLAPQGRRPYGFDWEAWARADLLSVIDCAQVEFSTDPRRTYLTGHSMGGHGAWHLGVSYPDKFAAIGPSSGWISFWSYGGGMPSAETPSDIDALLLRGYSASDTLKLLSNLANTGVYVLHGAADQNVPVAQARFMRTRLASFHPNFVYYEEPAADHWWGNECCDWPRMMEFFRHQSLSAPAKQTLIEFATANPAVSSRCHWVSVEAQQEQLSPSHVAIRQNVEARTFVGNTTNVARLAIDVEHLPPNQPIDVTLDGQDLHWLNWPEGVFPKLWFERQGDEWSVSDPPSPQLKGPARYGTFNAAFDHDALLVYGTGGTEEENNWAAAKARYDAETFYYRGGGALEVLPDTRFDFNRDTDRSVILYGNADTNRAWPTLLATSPVEVRRGHVRVGTRTESGDGLAVLTVRPRPGSDVAMVGIVGGTGPAGMRLTNRLRWFVSGIVYPDLMILGPKVLSEGTADVRAWGYFGLDWQVDSGEIAWRDASL